MKKLFLILLLCTAVAVACSKDGKETEPVLKTSNTEGLISVKNTACSESVKITTNQTEWNVTVTPNVDWITLTKDKGTLNIEIQENNTDKEREAEITITAGKLSEKIKVKQEAGKIKEDDPKPEDPKPEDPVDSTLNVSKSVINAKAEGIEETVTITTNQDSWSFEKANEITWITLTKENNNLKIVVEANSNKDSREAVVTVKAGELSKNITIKQEGKKESQGGGETTDISAFDPQPTNYKFKHRVLASVYTSLACFYCPAVKKYEEAILNSSMKDSVTFINFYADYPTQYTNPFYHGMSPYLFYTFRFTGTPSVNLDFNKYNRNVDRSSEQILRKNISNFYEANPYKNSVGIAAKVTGTTEKLKVKAVIKTAQALEGVKIAVWAAEDGLQHKDTNYDRIFIGGNVKTPYQHDYDFLRGELVANGNIQAEGSVTQDIELDIKSKNKDLSKIRVIIFVTSVKNGDDFIRCLNAIECKVNETQQFEYLTD